MRRVLVVLVLAFAGCSPDGDEATGGGDASTTSTSTSLPVPTTTSTTVAEAPRPPVPANDCRLGSDPSFKPTYLPPGFGKLADYPRPTEGDEPYLPHFHYPGPGEAEIVLYHGNSWRLGAYALVRELQVMGRTGWLSRYDGHSLIDFPVATSADPCDYWALGEAGITEAELLRVAASLAPA